MNPVRDSNARKGRCGASARGQPGSPHRISDGQQASPPGGGALINDDGTGGNGGILIVDTDDRAEAERFIADDPFSKAGLFEKVTITRWRKAFFDKQRLI